MKSALKDRGPSTSSNAQNIVVFIVFMYVSCMSIESTDATLTLFNRFIQRVDRAQDVLLDLANIFLYYNEASNSLRDRYQTLSRWKCRTDATTAK